MLSYLAEWESFWGPLRLFQFITFRAGFALVTAFLIGFFIAPRLFKWLKASNLFQPLRSEAVVGDLAVLHRDKAKTPTMGGLVIFIALILSTLLWVRPNVYTWVALFVYASLTGLGFLDDFFKIRERHHRGVPGRYKLLIQAMIALVALAILFYHGDSRDAMNELWVPFIKQPLLPSMGFGLALLLFFLVVAGSSNSINLTDGIDGLAISCTTTVAIVLAIMAYTSGHAILADYLYLRHILGAGELTIICAALLGASLAFLWYNAHPAEIFMGDTGSLGLGGLIGAIAFMVHQPFTLIIVAGVFVIEALSVILQVSSYKLRGGKRIFLMAPLHHHFQLKGWSESKVVARFWILSLLFAIMGLATLKLR